AAEHRRRVPVLAGAARGVGAVVSQALGRGGVVRGGRGGWPRARAVHAVHLAAHPTLVRVRLSGGVHPGGGRGGAHRALGRSDRPIHAIRIRRRRRVGDVANCAAGEPGRGRLDEAHGTGVVPADALVVSVVAVAARGLARTATGRSGLGWTGAAAAVLVLGLGLRLALGGSGAGDRSAIVMLTL